MICSGRIGEGAAALRSLPQRLASLPVAWFHTTPPPGILTALAEPVGAGADVQRLGPLGQQAVGQIVAAYCRHSPTRIGSVIQLVINLSAIAVAGTLTLLALRARADQLARRSPARMGLMRVGRGSVGD